MHRGLLGLEFRMHEGVSSPGIPKGGGRGAKNSDLLTSEVRKTNLTIAAFPKPAPGSLVSSENLTELGTRMGMGTKLQTNKMAGCF